jgi:ATP-dependent protease ClpP protease subunit
MPSFHDIVTEVQTRREESPQDYVLKKYLKRLFKSTRRPLILYASAFTEKQAPGRLLQLNRQDPSCFMAASSGLEGRELDLILHSPGGAVEASEQIVSFLRQRFDHIRVIVPVCAQSSAVLLCCAADCIVMGQHSSLGPIDPIVSWSHQGNLYSAAAQSLINEFAIAQRNINNKKNNPILWIERLKSYPPGLLAACKAQASLAQELAGAWLDRYMFRGDDTGIPEKISVWLADNRRFVSSERPVMIDAAETIGLKVERMEEDEAFAENVMAVYYAALMKFQTTDCVKVVINHLGKGCTFEARLSGVSGKANR